VQAYRNARRAGLKTTAHAGEFGMPWTNVRTALDLLQVDRIDHGYTVVDQPEFARLLASRAGVDLVVRSAGFTAWTAAHYVGRGAGEIGDVPV